MRARERTLTHIQSLTQIRNALKIRIYIYYVYQVDEVGAGIVTAVGRSLSTGLNVFPNDSMHTHTPYLYTIFIVRGESV